MYRCNCGKEFEKRRSLNSHARFCDQYVKTEKAPSVYKITDGLYRCECGREFDKAQSLNVHFSHCTIHRGGRPEMRHHVLTGKMCGWDKFDNNDRSLFGKKSWNTFVAAGGVKSPRSEETKRKISAAVKGKTGGYRKNSHKWKKCFIEQDGQTVWFDSTYELRFVKVLNLMGIKWIRNYQRFGYVHDGTQKKYTPDFYLPDFDIWVEIKGWEKEIDQYKWEQFPFSLDVIKKDRLENIEAQVS